MEWMERNPHQAHALYEQGNPHVVRLLSNLVLSGKRDGIVGPPYVNWDKDTPSEGAHTPQGWPQGLQPSPSLSQHPEDTTTPPKSPSLPLVNENGRQPSLDISMRDAPQPNRLSTPPVPSLSPIPEVQRLQPQQHQPNLQRTRSGRVTHPPLPYWIVQNISNKQSNLDTTMRDASQSTQQPSTTRVIDQASTYDYETDEEVLSAVTAYLDSTPEPKTLNSAKSRPDWPEWEQAVQDELDSLKENQVWNVVDRPKGRKVVDSKWVFKIKHNADGSIDRYKARLVAKGFTQIQGLDFDETFSPVVRYDTLRLLLALSAHFQWTPRLWDFGGLERYRPAVMLFY
jgi:hypothetical protein